MLGNDFIEFDPRTNEREALNERQSPVSTMQARKLQQLLRQRKISTPVRKEKQRAVYQFVLRNSPNISDGHFSTISNADLGLLFQITDEHFFDGMLGSICEQTSSKPLSFRLSTRMTTTGGMTTMQQARTLKSLPDFEIAIATTPLFDTFRVDGDAKVGGLVCYNRLEALQRIMEHEMLHLAELLLFRDSNCSAKPFKNSVRQLFGHTESNHTLLTPKDVARKKLGIACGDEVTFLVDGQRYRGFVNRITKRATVLVVDPKGIRYDDGQRYSKFYVPLAMLKRAG